MAEARSWRDKDIKVMKPEELLEKIREMSALYAPRLLRDRALIVVMYLTGGRVAEIVRKGFLGVGKDGLCKQDITRMEHEGRAFRIFRMRNLKNKKRIVKELPVAEDDSVNREMLEMLDKYTANLYDDEPLFPISTRRAQQIVANYLGKSISPHYFRHMRMTYLARDKELNIYELASYAGWSDISSASSYVHDNPKKLFAKL